MNPLKIRRALLSVSDKSGIVELAAALQAQGTEIVATGQTAQVLLQAGLTVIPIEKVSGSPEAFQGRMKTLSYSICSGILYRRGDAKDEADLKALGILPIDCVVVNFYPFEATLQDFKSKFGASWNPLDSVELVEKIDIGGPTLVRAAAKNSPDVLVLTSPNQYAQVIQELRTSGQVKSETANTFSRAAWDLVSHYDTVISKAIGAKSLHEGNLNDQGPQDYQEKRLRYGENPHQQGSLKFHAGGPIDWNGSLTSPDLSYNNILDVSAAYDLMSELIALAPQSTGVVIIKHNNPCGVSIFPKSVEKAQQLAFSAAWEGDPTSAFGSVILFSDPIEPATAELLAENFVELVAAPHLEKGEVLDKLVRRRKNLKALRVNRYQDYFKESQVNVPGGVLCQTTDHGTQEELRSVTQTTFPVDCDLLSRFGIAIGRALKSNAITLVREIPGMRKAFQLVGAGQGQPNRIDALRSLAIPRALDVLKKTGGELSDCILVSDAFFPFRDTVDFAHEAGIKKIIQPGGSMRDAESIQACNEYGIAMVFTGTRHFKH